MKTKKKTATKKRAKRSPSAEALAIRSLTRAVLGLLRAQQATTAAIREHLAKAKADAR